MNFTRKIAERVIRFFGKPEYWKRAVSVTAALVLVITFIEPAASAFAVENGSFSTQAAGEEYAAPVEPQEDSVDGEAGSGMGSGVEDAQPEEDSATDKDYSDNSSDEKEAVNTLISEEAAFNSTTEEAIAQPAEEIELITEATQLTFKAEDYTVYADFDGSANLPVGVELRVREITRENDPEAYEEYYRKALEQVQDKYDEDTELAFANFYDISFVYKDAVIEPVGNVQIRFEYRKAVDVEDTTAVDAIHFDKENEEKAEVIDATTEGDEKTVEAVEFESDKFSVYGIVGTETITTRAITASGETYEISVSYGPEAKIPSGAELRAIEIQKDTAAYNDYYRKSLKNIDLGDDPGFAVARLFDISIIASGVEVQPKTPVEVNIRLVKEGDAAVKDELAYIAVHVDETAEVIAAKSEGNTKQDEMSFEATSFSPYMLFGYSNKSVEGRTGVTNTENVSIRDDHYLISKEIGKIPVKGTRIEILGAAGGIVDGLFSQWYQIKYGDITGYVQMQYIDLLGLLEAKVGDTEFAVEGELPAGAQLIVKESDIENDTIIGYFNSNDRDLIHNMWSYDITIVADQNEWQPTEPVKVSVSSEKFTVGDNELLGVLHLEDGMDGSIPEYWVEVENKAFSFEARGFSPYVFYTVDTEYVEGERVRGSAWRGLLGSGFFSYWEQFLTDNEDDGTVITSETFKDQYR